MTAELWSYDGSHCLVSWLYAQKSASISQVSINISIRSSALPDVNDDVILRLHTTVTMAILVPVEQYAHGYGHIGVTESGALVHNANALMPKSPVPDPVGGTYSL
jgi:hypothetical protein